MCEKNKENNDTCEPTLVKTLLTAKASEKLAFEVEEELKKEDPPKTTIAEILKAEGGDLKDLVWDNVPGEEKGPTEE